MIKMEKIKLIRSKTNADYTEAMDVLNNCNQNVDKAILSIKGRGNLTKAEEQAIIRHLTKGNYEKRNKQS